MNLYTEEIKLKEENRLFYSDTGETKKLGCIGHLRGDFGHDGKEFWTTWFPHENHEKNDEVFREIFDRVINLCREKGNPLCSRGDMRAYCREYPECRLETGYSPTWGFRIPTQEYMLYLRCCPDVVGDYNFYVYAYDKQMLMKKLAEERGLPLYCYGYLPTTREEIRIDFATSGYTPYRKLKSDKDVKEINREIGVTPAQAEAMKVGSMFGWNVPGADPKSYDEKGKPIPPRSGGER